MFARFKLEKRVSELETSLERIEKAYKRLEVEWTDVYDKFRQLHMRVAKRQEALENHERTEPTEPATPEVTGGLTGRQALIQQQILSRRKARTAAANGGQ